MRLIEQFVKGSVPPTIDLGKCSQCKDRTLIAYDIMRDVSFCSSECRETWVLAEKAKAKTA